MLAALRAVAVAEGRVMPYNKTGWVLRGLWVRHCIFFRWMDVALLVQFEERGGGRGSTFYEKCSFRLNKTACAYRLDLHNAVRL